MRGQLGGIIAIAIAVLTLVVACSPSGAHERPLLLAATSFAALGAVVHLRWVERLPVWGSDISSFLASGALAWLMVHGGAVAPALPTVYALIGMTLISVRTPAVVIVHFVGLALSFAIGLAYGPGSGQGLVRWTAMIAAATVCGTFLRMLLTSFVALTRSEHEARADAERTATALREVNATKLAFLATMSHELRTPLNAIIGFADVLRLGYGGQLTSTQQTYVEDIAESGRHLCALVDDVLDTSQVEQGRLDLELTEEDLASLVTSCIAIVRAAAERRGITVRANAVQAIPMRVDERRIRQVLLNLLSNAIRFSGTGGEVTVSVAERDGRAVVAVTDTGPGVAPGDVERIFRPFEQAAGVPDGTGLGLPLARRFVEAHGGSIRVDPARRPGATFVFELPIFGPKADASATLPNVGIAADSVTYQALMVPGSHASRTMMVRFGAWYAVCGGAFAWVLAVVAAVPWPSRVMLVGFGLISLAVGMAISRSTRLAAPRRLDMGGMGGAVAITLITVLLADYADVVILAFAWRSLTTAAMLPRRKVVAKTILDATLFGVAVLAVGDLHWIVWLAMVVLVVVSGVIVHVVTNELRRVLHEERAARYEAEILRERLKGASRHKSEFMANMSHELRTPLNAVIGFADLLEARFARSLTSKQSAYVEDIRTAGVQLLRLINDILALAKIEAGRHEAARDEVCMRSLVDESVACMYDELETRKLTVTVVGSERAVTVGDRRWLILAVDNLIKNAADAAPPEGHVRIELTAEQNRIAVCVSDDGPGIPPHQRTTVFDPFPPEEVQRPDHSRRGTGLGLALVRGVVEAHGGSVEVESELGRGSTFTARLPVTSPTPSSTAAGQAS